MGLLNKTVKPLQPETADIDLAFSIDGLLGKRLADRRRVFKPMS